MKKIYRYALLAVLSAVSALPASADQVHLLASPCRVLDTRNGIGQIPSGGSLSFRVRTPVTSGLGGQSGCSVPKQATGVVMNLTAVLPSGPGHMLVYASNLSSAPAASRLNFNSGEIAAANEILVRLAPLGSGSSDITIVVGSASSDIVADIIGFLEPDTATLIGDADGVPGAGLLTVHKDGGSTTVYIATSSSTDFQSSWNQAVYDSQGSCVVIHGHWTDATTFEATSLPFSTSGSCR